MYYLSIDGGGSKTAILITDESGAAVGRGITGGCAYPEIGIDGVVQVIGTELERLFCQYSVRLQDIQSAAVGLPCFGENPGEDKKLAAAVAKLLPCCRIWNDVELGWAGSLGLEAGIHIVAGTGAIIYGRDRHGNSARANGWHEDFSDEGSGYWLGIKALSLFAKQLDGRRERSILYEAVQEQLGGIGQDGLVSWYTKEYQGKRNKIASLQTALLAAARKGDIQAIRIYAKAAEELAEGVFAVAGRLGFAQGQPIPVSYSGGVFHAGDLLKKPLTHRLAENGFKLGDPAMEPVKGGILLAAYEKNPQSIRMVRKTLEGRG